MAFGKRLKDAIADFTTDFIPHMKEEEEVGAWEEGGAKGEESGVVRVLGLGVELSRRWVWFRGAQFLSNHIPNIILFIMVRFGETLTALESIAL